MEMKKKMGNEWKLKADISLLVTCNSSILFVFSAFWKKMARVGFCGESILPFGVLQV
jgi:hypothetical protein